MAVILQTLSDLQAAFLRLVGETSGNTRWESPIQIGWLNEGQLDVVNRTRCLEEEFTSAKTAWVSTGDEVVTLPNNFYDDSILEIYWLDSSSDYHPLVEFHPRFQTIQNDSTGQPTEFFRIGSNIHLVPKQDASGSVVILGQKMPDELVNPTDQTLIPASWRKLIAQYAAWLAFVEDGEINKAVLMKRIYDDGILEQKKWAKKRRSKRTAQMMMPFTLYGRANQPGRR